MRTSGSKPREERATELADPGAMEELHRRENDGIAVSLVWSSYGGRLSVVVEDRTVGASFTLGARADNALEGLSTTPTPTWQRLPPVSREVSTERVKPRERYD